MYRAASTILGSFVLITACGPGPVVPDGGTGGGMMTAGGGGAGGLSGGSGGGMAMGGGTSGGTGGGAGGSGGGVAMGGGTSGGTAGGAACITSGAGGAVYIGGWNTFVSSVATNGNLGGRVGADQFCTRLARAAGRPGAVAHVSETGEFPLQQWIIPGQGQPAGAIWYGPYWSNEHGQPMDAKVWTGQVEDCAAGASCRSWTSSAASDDGIDVLPYGSASRPYFNLPVGSWPDAGRSSCDSRRSLLCVFHSRAFSFPGPPPPLPGPTRRLFVSRASFSGALGGVAGANRVCLDLARDGGQSGSWRAFLSTNGAAFTIGPGDGGWAARLDDDAGAVFQTVENLGTTPRHPFLVDEHGERLDGGALWTGTRLWTTPATPDCAGWTSLDGGGTAGTLGRLDETWSDDGVTACAAAAHLLCLEE